MSGKRVAKPENSGAPKKKSKAAGIVLGVIGALAVVLAAFCFYANLYTEIFPGVTAAGQVELSGLTKGEAERKLEQELPALLEATAHQVELEGQVLGTYTMSDTGYSPLTGAMAAAAMAVGREESGPVGWLMSGIAYGKGLLGMGEDIPLMVDRDEGKLDAIVSELAAKVDRPAADGSYELTREGLFATKHQDGVTVDREALAELFAQVSNGETERIECPVAVVPARQLDVRAMAEQLSGEASNAWYDIETGQVKDGEVGVSLDPEAASYVLEAAAGGETVQLPAEIIFPQMTAQELEAVLFRDLLGTCTTDVSGSSTRKTNVKLAGESVNGTILNDGDIFDYNKVVGERTTERGYGEAATYVNGETVNTVGGGICQVSSTVYLATLLANLEITERYAHRFYPGYITLGMDATVSWGGPEFRFKNNTGYPIRIDVSYANSRLTVNIYGTKTDDTYVKMTRDVLSTTGYETEYVETDELPYGTQKEKQNGYTGYEVQSYRNLYDGDGNLISKTPEAKSSYKSRNQIILVGTAGRPEAPEPTTPPSTGTDPGTEPEPVLPPDSGTETGGGAQIPEEPTLPDTEAPGWLLP